MKLGFSNLLEKFLEEEADQGDFWQRVKTNLSAGKITFAAGAGKEEFNCLVPRLIFTRPV